MKHSQNVSEDKSDPSPQIKSRDEGKNRGMFNRNYKLTILEDVAEAVNQKEKISSAPLRMETATGNEIQSVTSKKDSLGSKKGRVKQSGSLNLGVTRANFFETEVDNAVKSEETRQFMYPNWHESI